MKNEQHDSEWYLQDPRIRKWMVQCVACKRWGYRPDAPPKFHGRAQLERHIGEMKLDERGICDQCSVVETKNRAIEIHDSTLDAISVRDGAAVVHFPCVYIHESTGTPGVDAGSGWVQEALLRINGAAVTRSFSKLPADLLDGYIKLGDEIHKNEIPIPLSHKGIVELHLESWNDEVVLITGSSAELELIGEPKYVENFRP
jgi:hypothetical protein